MEHDKETAWRGFAHQPCRQSSVCPRAERFQEALALACGLKRTYVGALARKEVNSGIDNLDELARGVGVLTHVLLMSAELAYGYIFAAFSRS